MSSKRRRRGWLAAVLAAAGAGAAISCQDSTGYTEAVLPPDSLLVAAASMRSVRVEWPMVGSAEVSGYQVERRKDLQGPFEVVVPLVAQQSPGPIRYLDLQVEPETHYGYQVRTVGRLGGISAPTVIRGAKTPPKPGVLVRVASTTPTPNAVDADGYMLELKNSHEVWVRSIGPAGNAYFPALPSGHYTIAMRGVAQYCGVAGQPSYSLELSDEGPNTVDTVGFSVVCRDPSLGRVVAMLQATGDSLDADGYGVELSGIAADQSLPDSVRVVSQRQRLPAPSGGSATLDNLRPGSYQLVVDGVATQCTTQGQLVQDMVVEPLSSDTAFFQLTCNSAPPATGSRPYILVNEFAPATGPAGSKVTLRLSLDLRANGAARVTAAQATMFFDQAVLRFDSAAAEGSFGDITGFSGSTPGQVSWLVGTTGTPQAGLVPLARMMFTVTGTAGAHAGTRNRDLLVAGAAETTIDTLVRVVEDTFSVGGGTPANTPPVAEANGPYTATAGSALTVSAAGSSDPDGSVSSYVWEWRDGTANSTGASTSATHTYAAAGTYVARLTVTDNLGATKQDSAVVTVTGGGGGGGGALCDGTALRLCNTWAPQTGANGQKVRLDINLDLRSEPSQTVSAAQASLGYDTTRLRYDSTSKGALTAVFTAGTGPAVVNWLAISTGPFPGGLVPVAKIHFTVIGASGSVITNTITPVVAEPPNDDEFTSQVTIVEDTLSIGGGGGNQAPVAEANGPYSGSAGSAIGFTGAGSTDPDGSVASYSWNWGDGTAAGTGQTPSHTYAAAGSYTVTLTVTDNQGGTDTDTAPVTVAAVTPPLPLTMAFGAISNDTVRLTISLDLTSNIPETPSTEALQSWTIDSLKWNAAVLEYQSVSFVGSGYSGFATGPAGRRTLTGLWTTGNSGTGVVQLASIKFRIIGTSGQSTTTATALGTFTGTAGTNSYNYKPKIAVTEATLGVP